VEIPELDKAKGNGTQLLVEAGMRASGEMGSEENSRILSLLTHNFWTYTTLWTLGAEIL
jgi:hypothetical protein